MKPANPLAERALSDFAVNLYQHAGKNDESICLSPVSVALAVSMVYYGAGGQTKMQLAQMLFGQTLKEGEEDAYVSALMNSAKPECHELVLYVANRLYTAEGFQIRSRFSEVLKNLFHSSLVEMDFSDSKAAAAKINSWVEEVTHNKIKDMVPAESLSSSTSLVLLSAIYFSGQWLDKFYTENTSKRTFYVAPGREVKVDMMHKTTWRSHGTHDDCHVLELPYIGGMAMFVFLPKDRFGLKQFADRLTGKVLIDLMQSVQSGLIELALPKFRVDSDFELKPILEKMGLTDMFTASANLSGIAVRQVSVSSATHKTYIQVDEKGTEAAAATSMLLAGSAFNPDPPKPIPFIADHPFMFAIVSPENKIIHFLGRFVGPSD